jgi:hypothetical protein
MRRQVARRFDEEPGERIVDLRGFDAAKPEADAGDGGDEGFEKRTEVSMIPGLAPGVSRASMDLLPIGPDVNPREHNLDMILSKRLRFLY